MATVLKISINNKPEEIRKAIRKLAPKKKKRKLIDILGKLPGVYGDGLVYQKKMRNEW
jgi:hypothetical protein